ncbi:MAG TPA: bifunctional glutamate N-acetyltransferase/amino-acid acetyltransferase ArgJ [Pseudomonadales bacterium]|nr:bifunctional glutamate N-acetyltransferase/amino-acid acetyltransferase ArgJ [Pseudomonadales bacterium]
MHPVKGVKIGTTQAGVRYKNRRDLTVFEIAEGASVAGVFTLNAFCAAPVHICKQNLASTATRYLLINTGCANAGTGPQGFTDAQATCAELAKLTGVSALAVLPFSTGVIGEKLPVDRINAGLPGALAALSESGWEDAAHGIMTTDTLPKGASVKFTLGGKECVVTGISKGAGMIKPNMATMLAYVATDAAIDGELLKTVVKRAADASFNRVTVDGDTSTNDSCILIATGKSGAPLIKSEADPDFDQVYQAIETVLIQLAQAIVRDGEGATKFITVQVEKGGTISECQEVAYTIAHSPLIKTAFFASDPNWGRILAAVGRAPLYKLDVDKVDIYLNEVCIVRQGGVAADYTEEKGAAVMKLEEITIRVILNRGEARGCVWTTDLSYDYVKINADYRS